jgi:hypothetical protein
MDMQQGHKAWTEYGHAVVHVAQVTSIEKKHGYVRHSMGLGEHRHAAWA